MFHTPTPSSVIKILPIFPLYHCLVPRTSLRIHPCFSSHTHLRYPPLLLCPRLLSPFPRVLAGFGHIHPLPSLQVPKNEVITINPTIGYGACLEWDRPWQALRGDLARERAKAGEKGRERERERERKREREK